MPERIHAPLTLVLDGAVRADGDTHALLDAFLSELDGEVLRIGARDAVAPCCDCRFCQTHDGCAIHDRMTEVYRRLADCTQIVIASPVWYASLSGPLLTIASRFQPLFYAAEAQINERRGVILLAGGHAGSEAGAERAAKIILRQLGVRAPRIVKSMDTDRVPAHEDAAALADARAAAREWRDGAR